MLACQVEVQVVSVQVFGIMVILTLWAGLCVTVSVLFLLSGASVSPYALSLPCLSTTTTAGRTSTPSGPRAPCWCN